MANYYATTRSNYFRVKNAKAFKEWCDELCLDFWTRDREDDTESFYAISADTCSGWPTSRMIPREDDPDVEDDVDVDVAAELADHLDPRDVAVLMEAGNESRRYVEGYATAVHPNGQTVSVNLNDIYARAQEAFGADVAITEAVY